VARTAIVPIVPAGGVPTLPLGAGSADVTLAAADNVNGNSVPSTGRELILVQGTGNVTVRSSATGDPFKRIGDITSYVISAAPKVSVLGPFPVNGWRQVDGTLWIDSSAATVLLAVVQLPPTV